MMNYLTGNKRFALMLAFACFTAQGIANGLLGVAWPSMRGTFGLPLDALLSLLISSTIGYVIGSVAAMDVMRRIGIGRSLLVANVLAAVGLLGYAVSPAWWVLVLFGILLGWTSGTVGASLNIFVAATRTVRIMNWMHAMYGVGATIGPLIMTIALSSRFGWPVGYIFAALLHLFLGLLFVPALRQMDYRGLIPSTEMPINKTHSKWSSLSALRTPIILLGILLFLFYTGIETTTGQWSYSLFTEERSMSPSIAGISISVYWGMLTVGRIVFGAAANRIGIPRLLRLSMAGTVFSALLFLVPTTSGSFAAVALMGLSLAAIFPTLMADTPNRVGPQQAASAIGLQTGAASIGLALLPGLAGVLAARLSLEVIGPYLIIASSLMLLTNEAAIRSAHRSRLKVEAATSI